MTWRAAGALAALLLAAVVVARLVQDTETGTATWDASRASGFVSYLLLWAAVVTGVSVHLRFRPGSAPLTWVLEAHRVCSALAFSFLAVHVVALLLDPVVVFDPIDGVIPFTTGFRPIQVGIGTLAQWCLAAVLLSTAIASQMPRGAWRAIHFLSYPAYVLALLHSITAGSDSSASLAVAAYAGTAAVVAAVSILRLAGRNWAAPRDEILNA